MPPRSSARAARCRRRRPRLGSIPALPPTLPLPGAQNIRKQTGRRALADRGRAALAGVPADVVLQPTSGRHKRLFLADMDSTMIGQECIDELADYAGVKPQVAAITERAMRGEIEFAPAL